MEEGNRREEGRVRNNLFLSFSVKVNQISSCCMNSRPALLFLAAPLFLLIKHHLQINLPLTLTWRSLPEQAGETSPSCVPANLIHIPFTSCGSHRDFPFM